MINTLLRLRMLLALMLASLVKTRLNDVETNIVNGPFVNISRIVGISRGTSCILFT